MPTLQETLSERLDGLHERQQFRQRNIAVPEAGARIVVGGKRYLNFSSNDYFGLSQHPDVIAAAKAAIGPLGAGASALVSGYLPAHARLETVLAQVKDSEAALLFGSGYLANIGVISAVMAKDDLILADRYAHACMFDGARLSGAKLIRFKHNDSAHLARLLNAHRHQYRHCLIMTETVFSMDGDAAPLAELAELSRRHDCWLLTDDAHGIGIVEHNPADIQIGTLSKGLGAYGGYVCGASALIDYLVNHARSAIFSTALPASVAAAAEKALEILQADKKLKRKPIENAALFCHQLGLAEPVSPIVPLIYGDNSAALAAAAALREQGFWVAAIRPPTVPQGSARLRFTFSALHQPHDIERLCDAVHTTKRQIGADFQRLGNAS